MTLSPSQQLRFPEFITLMAMMSSLMALSIDAMLPALPMIGAELGVVEANDNQMIISSLFVGMAIGLMIYGPLSDYFGRKRPLYAGLALFIIGCLISIEATTFNQMLFGRIVQGMGLAAPRVVSLAMIRDLFQKEAMARVMSFVMMVFILVPALAPALGQLILLFAPWQAIFKVFLVLTSAILLWFGLRQPETLPVEKRLKFSVSQLSKAMFQVVKLRAAMGPTVTLGIVFGAFLGYLGASQQIFQGLYDKGNQFALYFGLLALCFGAASMLNARLVSSYGMRHLSRWSLAALTGVSLVFLGVTFAWAGVPPFWTFFIFLACSFSCIAILFGNLNALAMEPLGHLAGVGAAMVGMISTLISASLGQYIGHLYDQTVLPLVTSFAILGLTSFLILSKTTQEPVVVEAS